MMKGTDTNKGAFSGLTVVSFSWAMAGPLTMKFLADYGAKVIRIETTTRTCLMRTSPPFKDDEPGINRSGYYNYHSANMLSFSLNMSHPLSADVAKRLIAKGDVVMENFAPGVMEKWGLTYDELKMIKPDIIMLRQSGYGSSGPYAHLPSYGMILAAISGLSNFIGWPDRDPLPVGIGAYTDCISPRFAAAALIAALDYRDRTGKGQLLDLSQFETAVYFILPAILDYQANGREPVRRGNAHQWAAPHGVYPCKGDDRWCTIAVYDDKQWAALCEAIGDPQYKDDEEFATVLQRKRNEENTDALLGQWTVRFDTEELVSRLQAVGIAAGPVEDARDNFNDPQLRERNFFWSLMHREIGLFEHLGAPAQLSLTPPEASRPAPCLGEDTEYICAQMLGMSDEEFATLVQAGVLE